MRTVLLASLRTHTRRYVAAAVAVVIGVAFVVVTSALSSATRNGLVAGVGLPYENADVVVSQISGEDALDVVTRAREQGDQAAVLGWTRQPVTAGERLVDDAADVGLIASDPALRWQDLREGRLPAGADEAVADSNAAKSDQVAVGDELRIGSGNRALTVTVVGLVDTPSASAGASIYLPDSELGRFASSFGVDSIAYAGSGSVDDQVQALTDATRRSGAAVQPTAEFVQERQAELTQEVDVIAIVLLIFASIAIFVSVLVIANTFTILFAQRTRDFALLRCVGATRRQVLRSVRAEAVVLGVASSLLGLVVGTALGYGLVALASAQLQPGIMGEVTLSPSWYAAAFAIGLLVTVVAAWLPTRKVVAVNPLAALRPDTGIDVRTTAGRVRTAAGVLLVVAGAATLGLAIDLHDPLVMVAGGVASFSGLLLLGPVVVPALLRVAGAGVGRALGAAGRLAAGNAVRNPRRTAATTASLLVGVTLTTAVLTGLASSRSAVASDLDLSHPLDLTVTSNGAPLPPNVLADVRATHGVVAAVGLEGTTAELSKGVGSVQLVAAPPVAESAAVVHGSPQLADPGPGEVHVPWEAFAGTIPRRVDVTVDGRTERLEVVSGDSWGAAAVVAPETLARFTESPTPRAVWVRADSAADPEDLAGDVTAIAAGADAEVANGLAERAWVDTQLDILTGSVVALLGIAVAIALIGIGNTLGLSVLERVREHALLRALGLTRRQLRQMLATEAVLLSVVATVLGTAIGVVFAWVGLQTLVAVAVEEVPLVMPWGQLLLVVLVAGLAGLLACLLPARRAARTAPAAGLSLD